MLAIAPHLVRLKSARPGALAPVAELIDAMRAGGVAAVSESGVLGDPSGADSQTGEDLLVAATRSALQLLDRWPARGRL